MPRDRSRSPRRKEKAGVKKKRSKVDVSSDLDENEESDQSVNTGEGEEVELQVEKESDGKFHCPMCSNVYRKRKILKTHLMKVHSINAKFTNFFRICTYPGCNLSFWKKQEFCDHLRDAHNEDIDEIDVFTEESHASSNQYINGMPVEVDIEKGADDRFHCPMCTCSYTKRTRLRLHLNKFHGLLLSDNHFSQACNFPGCKEKFFKKNLMIEHQKTAHDIEFDERNFQFQSLEEFYNWKEHEESSNYFYFKKSDNKDKNSFLYFVCHYSSRRDLRKDQPVCPALIKVAKNGSNFDVYYIANHNHMVSLGDMSHQRVKFAKIDYDRWLVQSMNLHDTIYSVKKMKDKCSCEEEKIGEDGLCSHIYICDCPSELSICRHVGKIIVKRSKKQKIVNEEIARQEILQVSQHMITSEEREEASTVQNQEELLVKQQFVALLDHMKSYTDCPAFTKDKAEAMIHKLNTLKQEMDGELSIAYPCPVFWPPSTVE